MKKKIRSILVNDREFNWLVDERIWPECVLKIWISGIKGKLWIECNFNAPISVTPRTITSLIDKYFHQLPSNSETLSTIKVSGDEIGNI